MMFQKAPMYLHCMSTFSFNCLCNLNSFVASRYTLEGVPGLNITTELGRLSLFEGKEREEERPTSDCTEE